jgi:hypothetical protein
MSPRCPSTRFGSPRLPFATTAFIAIALSASACRRPAPQDHRAAAPPPPTASVAAAPTAVAVAPKPRPAPRVFAPARAGCDAVPVFVAGASAGSVCAEDAARSGLTVVDLSDTWTPRVFAQDPRTGSAPEYRAKYLELASQPNGDLGLHGIAPTLSILAGRLDDEKRRACDEAVDLAPIQAVAGEWASAPDARSAAASLKLAQAKPALAAVQGVLACAGFLKPSAVTGVMSSATHAGLEAFRRRNMIVGGGFDGDTVRALSLGGEELAFRGLLRGLRERVADAAGLIEDGSASGEMATVLGRELDLSRFSPVADGNLEEPAFSLVDDATEAAARELGWTSPDAARAFLAARGRRGLRGLKIAVTLPAAPAYHSAAMDLRVEIDRGDVLYEAPGQAALAKKSLGKLRAPSFVLYAKHDGRDVALLRWNTTIGGWKKERTESGEIALKYKESDVGERMWRRIIAAPAWLPPDSTPEADLLSESKDGTVSLKRDLLQPGYRNAYGLVMLIHDKEVTTGDKTTWSDHGIRTHGSVDYRSIRSGTSHGCHRLYNQLALRLAGYLLQHRAHKRRGTIQAGYRRTLAWKEQSIEVDIPERGYLYEIDPPVPVRVLQGRIAGQAQKPISSVIPLKTDKPS